MTQEQVTSLYNSYYKRLYNISLRILGDPVEAEEVMHDTLLKYIDKGMNLFLESQRSAWLSRTCIRASIDRLRKRRREALLFTDDFTGVDIPEEKEEDFSGITLQTVLKTISRMDENERVILDLVLIEQQSYQEISQMTGIKEPTLRARFCRAKANLCKKLKQTL